MPRDEHTSRDWLSCENPSRTEEPGCWEGAAGSSSDSQTVTHMGLHCECTKLHTAGCPESWMSLSAAAVMTFNGLSKRCLSSNVVFYIVEVDRTGDQVAEK